MTFAPKRRSLAQLAALTSAATGFWALLVWILGDWRLISMGADYIPMAPSTGLLFLVLGLALSAQERWPESRGVRTAGSAAALLTLAVSGATLVQSQSNLVLPWTGWLVGAPASVGDILIGRMSPLTALCFLLTAVALLGQRSRRADRPLVRHAAYAANGVAFATATLVALSYLAGTPLFYSAGFVPMALLTALAFLALNGSLFLSGLLDRLWEKWRAHDTAAHAPEAARAYSRRLLLVSSVLCGLIILAGTFYLRREHAEARAAVCAQLDAIAQLKAGQIRDWRNERMGEARFLCHTSAVVQDIAAFVARPDDAAVRARVTDWLEPIKGGDRYESLAVFDLRARPLLSIPATSNLERSVPPDLWAQALAGREPVFTELHFDAVDPIAHFSLLVPIRPRGGSGGGQLPPVAVVVMRLDPRHFLFPLIQKWPLPSDTAETLLVRREGDAIIYLNIVRHNADEPLFLRRSIHEPLLPAARAGRGEFGVAEGVDYRGVPVLSATRPIPESPWFLIAKIDLTEAYAAIQRDAWQTGLAVLLLLVAVGLAGTSLWRWRHASFLRRALVNEQARQALAQRFGLVMRHANDCILLMDDAGRVLDANDRTLTTYGYTLEELRALPPGGLRPPAAAGGIHRQIGGFAEEKGTVFETEHRRKDGSIFPVEVSGSRVVIGGHPHLLGIYRDITWRKAQELEIERLNRMYQVISQLNQAIVRNKAQSGLFPEVCRVLVKFGGFRIAWIGWPNQTTKELIPVAVEGDAHGYVPGLKVSLDPARPESRGPSGVAFLEGRTVVCNDFFGDPTLAPWHERARKSGFQSSIALPLHLHGTVRGLLTVYAAEINFFGPQEIRLLEQAADDLSFALDVFDGEGLRLEAEAALRESEQKYRILFESSRDVIMTLEPPSWRFTSANPATLRMFGAKDEAEFTALEPWRLSPPLQPDGRPSQDKAREMIGRAMKEGTCFFEWTHRRTDGSEFPAEVRLSRMERKGKMLLQAAVRDITERKQAEAALRESEAIYHSLVEQLPAGVFRKDSEGRYTFVSPWFCRFKGVNAEDFLGKTAQEVADDQAARRGIAGKDIRYMAEGHDHHRQVMVTGRVVEAIEEYPQPGGRTQFVQVIKAPITGPEGKPIGTLGIVFDITATKQAETALRESEQRYRHIAENTLDSIWLYDLAAGSFLYVSPSTERMLGYTSGELMAKGLTGILTPESAAATDRLLQERLAARAAGQTVERNYTGEFEVVHKNGSILTCEVSANLLVDAAGQPVRILGVTRDITARRRTETALRESEFQLRQAQSIAGLGSYNLDITTGRWTSSQVLDQVLGLDPAGDHSVEEWLSLIHPEDRDMMDRYFRDEVVGQKKRFLREYRVIRQSDHVVRWVWGTGRLDFDAQGRPVRMRGTIQDITERKQVELQLQKLSQAVEQSPTSIVITDLTGAIEYVNPWFTTLTGYTLQEVIGKNPRVLKSGDTPPETYTGMWQTLTAGRTWRGELRNKKKNGELYTELVVIAPVFDADGRPTHYVAIKDDITERARTEVALRESEARFRELFDLETDAILVVETDTGRILQANLAAASVYGYTVAELLAQRSYDLTAEPEKARQFHITTRENLDQVIRVPYRLHRKKDGTVFPVEVGVRPFRRGDQFLHVTVVRDITEQVAARETLQRFNTELEREVRLRTHELAESEQRRELVLQANAMGTFEIDLASGEGRWNEAEYALLGLKPGEAPSCTATLFRHVHPEDLSALMDQWERALHTGKLETEFRIVRTDGQERWLAARGQFVLGDAQTGRFFGINYDITAQKRHEAETAALLERERQVSEMKTRFISMTSHEFRTPMTSIMGSVELLANHLERLSPSKRAELFERVNTSLQRMTTMLDDVLTLNRMDANRIEVRLARVNLAPLVQGMIQEIRTGDRNAHPFTVELSGENVPFVTDAGLFHHILSNLLSNAVRYSPAGAPVTVRFEHQPWELRLVVEDRGIGVPAADRARIFEPFERGSNVGNLKGTGLGLNIVKRMAELLGGTVTLEPVEGGGSRFTIVLPVLEPPPPRP